jgi:HEAT repeats
MVDSDRANHSKNRVKVEHMNVLQCSMMLEGLASPYISLTHVETLHSPWGMLGTTVIFSIAPVITLERACSDLPCLSPRSKPMFSRIPTQNSVFTTALALFTATVALAITTPSHAQNSDRPTIEKQTPTRVATSTKSAKQPSPILAATSKRTTDWLVPGILGGSVMVGGVALVLMLKRSNQALVTEAPEPLRYNPDPTPSLNQTDLKATQAPTPIQASAPKSTAQKSKKTKGAAQPPEAIQPEAVKPESTAIAHATTRMPKVSVMDVLVHDLRSNDPVKRQKAIWELGRRGDSRAVQPLVDLLLDSDSRQRSLVLSALSEISTRTLKPMSRALAISMQDENADVRKNAIRDLTRIYDTLTNISQLLHSACDDPDLEVQETAKWAIGQINRIKSPMIQGAGRSVSMPESLN